jgi:predicted metalloendopeptidase
MEMGADPDHPETQLVHFVAGAFGLGSADPYLATDAIGRKRLDAYRRHLERWNELLGMTPGIARTTADESLRFETTLAGAVRDARSAEGAGTCTRTELTGLDALQPRLPWRTFLEGADVHLDAVALCPRAGIAGVAKLLQDTRQRALQSYLRVQVLQATAPLLGRAFLEEERTFQRELGGNASEPSSWQRCVALTGSEMGDALAHQESRSPSVPGAQDEIVRATRNTLAASLASASWIPGMKDPARKNASVSVARAVLHDGVPPTRDVSSMQIERGTLLLNVLESRNLAFKRMVADSGSALDPATWWPPRSLRAAGSADPPPLRFATTGASAGAILARSYDPVAVREAQACIERSARAALPAFASSPAEVLQEISGVHAAFGAWRAYAAAHADAGRPVEGMSADQLFFLAYARDACARAVDDEASAAGRIDAALALVPEFSRAFQCPAQAPMQAKDSCAW